MFRLFFKDKYTKELEDSIERLETQITKLMRENVRAKEFEDNVNAAYRKCEMIIDFKAVDVFSIERLVKDTKLGFIDRDGKVREWYFNCDEDNHNRLVTEFRESMKSKCKK